MLRRYKLWLAVSMLIWVGWMGLRATYPAASTVEIQHFSGIAAQTSGGKQVSTPVPEQLSRALLEQAVVDPFAVAAAAQPASFTMQAKALPIPASPTVAATQAPPLGLRFAGRTSSPDGHETVYATYGELTTALTTGLVLPHGYRVDAITESAVHFSYPPLNTTAHLDLPTFPRLEIR
jgi:hypothetical protein